MNALQKNNVENNPQEQKSVVIITGASSGLGRAFAVALDERLPQTAVFWLIARHKDTLEETAATLNRDVRLLPLDLTLPESFTKLNAILEKERPVIRYLVNNAGEGRAGNFENESFDAHKSLCDLNVRAPLLLTSLALPWIEQESRLLFTSSVAAFLPQPGFASYAASKSMILSFARALSEELRPRGIHVAVTCPNPMMTDFFTSEEKEAFQKSYKRLSIEDPDVVVQKTLEAVERGRRLIVTGGWGKAIHIISRLIPISWMTRIIAKLSSRDT